MGHFGCHCLNAQCYSCEEYGHFEQDCPNKICLSGTPHTMTDLVQGINVATIAVTDHTPPTVVTDMGDISTGHNQTAISPAAEAASSFKRHISCSSSHHCSSLWCPLTDGHPHCHSHCDTSNQHICTQSCTHHFHRCHSCIYSMDQSWSCSSKPHHTAQEPQSIKKAMPHPRPSTPIDPIIPRLSSSRTPNQILPQIPTATQILKLLEPSPSSNEDKWGGQSSSFHYT